MNLLKSSLVLCVLTAATLNQQALAEIYKITKPDGSVVYSDRPIVEEAANIEAVPLPDPVQPVPMQVLPASNPQPYTGNYSSSQPVYPNGTPTNNNSASPSSISPNSAMGANKDVNLAELYKIYNDDALKEVNSLKAMNYNVTLLSPSDEQAFRKPAQMIDVAVSVKPSPRATDQVYILVDGKEIANGMSASIPTVELLPGEHALSAKVVSAGNETYSESRTFYVIQNNIAIQQQRQLEKQIQAYYQLPWYKRLMIQLSRNKLSQDKVNSSAPKVSTAFP